MRGLVEALPMFTQLKELYLHSNDLQDEGAAILAEFLQARCLVSSVCPLTESAVSRRKKGCKHAVEMSIAPFGVWPGSPQGPECTFDVFGVCLLKNVGVPYMVLKSNHNVLDVGAYSSLLWKTLAHRTSLCDLSALARFIFVFTHAPKMVAENGAFMHSQKNRMCIDQVPPRGQWCCSSSQHGSSLLLWIQKLCCTGHASSENCV